METTSKSPVRHDFTASPVRNDFSALLAEIEFAASTAKTAVRRHNSFFSFSFRENNGTYFPFFLFLIHPERIGKVKPCMMKRGPPYWDTRPRQKSASRLLQGLNSIHDMHMLNRPRERFSSHHVAFMLVIQSEYIWDTWRQPQFFPESLQAAHER